MEKLSTKSSTGNLVIYGGSFDPLHNGHVSLVRMAHEDLNAHVLVVPVNNHQKDGHLIPLEERIFMAKEAFKDYDYVDVVDWGVTWDEPHYTYKVINQFIEKHEDVWGQHNLWLALGADALKGIPSWKNADEVLEKVQIICYPRERYDISSSAIREGRMDLLDNTPHTIHEYLEKYL